MTPARLADLFNSKYHLPSFTLRGGSAVVCCLSTQRLPRASSETHVAPEWREWSEMHRLVGSFLLPMSGISELQFPASQHWVRFVLPSNEVEEPVGRMKVARGKGSLTQLHVFSVRKKRPKFVGQISSLLTEWVSDASKSSIYGETFDCRLEGIRPYAIEGDENSFEEIGIQATFDRLSSVTWPWADLYLFLRLNLKRADRVSFRFGG